MEKDFLDLLYFGKIVPWEQNNDPSPRSEELRDLIEEDIQHLSEVLTGDDKAVFERLMKNRLELTERQVRADFKAGFRLGAQLILDTFCSSKQS